MQKKAILLGLAILVLAVIVLSYRNLKNKDDEQGNNFSYSHEFRGTLNEVRGDKLIVTGAYVFDDPNVPVSGEVKTVEISIPANLMIKRVELIFPPSNNGQQVVIDNLPKKETLVDFATLKQDSEANVLGIFAKSQKDINYAENFSASELTYRTPKFQ